MIRAATVEDAARVMAGLQALAADMGDPFRTTGAQVATALASGAIRAELADHGLALWSPFLSTTRGRMGAYVSDLWVGAEARGQGLGRQLLAAVRNRAEAEFGASFLRLAVYDDNPRARVFYDRLGFTPKADEIWLTLEGAALEAV
ncbi:GNAT family N-acetyltransferase [Gemmobacter sp. LW-1]|jgi:ribosomal protein S18 acetylase RimI-like enzyme|uniref:GNAT family N-acetyltransferase n=1 Tax=Gemmobacter sp. LW-1 TaxID=1529005 RepID=UPI0006C75BB2|nr:GNAT family N-acetyltransferase [Gemmobacter sp. LW-1]OJY33735.1 MAG: hypothetical protein BGP11_23040 [Rhodobacterales bacterium 65-51]